MIINYGSVNRGALKSCSISSHTVTDRHTHRSLKNVFGQAVNNKRVNPGTLIQAVLSKHPMSTFIYVKWRLALWSSQLSRSVKKFHQGTNMFCGVKSDVRISRLRLFTGRPTAPTQQKPKPWSVPKDWPHSSPSSHIQSGTSHELQLKFYIYVLRLVFISRTVFAFLESDFEA